MRYILLILFLGSCERAEYESMTSWEREQLLQEEWEYLQEKNHFRVQNGVKHYE